jgi:hypothetical protein
MLGFPPPMDTKPIHGPHYRLHFNEPFWALGAARAVDGALLLRGPLRVD